MPRDWEVRKLAAMAMPSMKLCIPSPTRFRYAKGWTGHSLSWQWRQRLFSRRKKNIIPATTVMRMFSSSKRVSLGVARDSGIRWKNAPPSRAPDAKLTSKRSIFFNTRSFMVKNMTPISEIRLTRNVERRIQASVSMLSPLFLVECLS